jgi:hypothetical protein
MLQLKWGKFNPVTFFSAVVSSRKHVPIASPFLFYFQKELLNIYWIAFPEVSSLVKARKMHPKGLVA